MALRFPARRATAANRMIFQPRRLFPARAFAHKAANQRPPEQPANERFREFQLDGKVFAVTGGARGLGLTMAEALAEAGGDGIFPRKEGRRLLTMS